MGEKEVCYGCAFYNSDAVELCNKCKAPKHIKDSCTYWSNEKNRIMPVDEKELKPIDIE